jgi:DNA-binding HxlR family transcriptional regulator
MSPNLENRFRILYNDHKILSLLKQRGPLRFTEIHRQTSGSERTLSKHLKSLYSNSKVERLGKRYRITEMGRQYIARLEKELKATQRYEELVEARLQGRLVDSTVEVSRIEPRGHLSLASFKVSLTRRLQPMERQKLDRALTQAIHILSSVIPEGTKEYEATISGTL